MIAERVIINPESLLEVSQQFKRRADMHQQNLSTILGELNTLRSQGPEGWIGDAANQHFMEMEQYVLPGYRRLIEALNEATATVKFTQNEFDTADQEGSKAFKQLESTGNSDAEAAIQKGGGGAPSSVDTGGAGQSGGSSGGGPSGGGSPSGSGGGPSGGGSPSGSGDGSSDSGQQGAGGSSQNAGSSGSLGAGSGSNNASTGGVRSGGAVSQASSGGNGWIAGAVALGGTLLSGLKVANDVRNK